MLVLSDAIKLDLSFRETYLVPLIVVDSARDEDGNFLNEPMYISTNKGVFSGDIFWEDFDLKLSSVKESLDLVGRNYKINNLSFTLSNYYVQDKRISDFVADRALLNKTVEVYYKTQSCKDLDDCVLIFKGNIRRFDHDSKVVRVELEDLTEEKLSKELPIANTGFGGNLYSKEHKNKPIPMVYGSVEKAPAIPFINLDSQSSEGDINIICDDVFDVDRGIEMGGFFGDDDSSTFTSQLCPLYIYKDNYFLVLKDYVPEAAYEQGEGEFFYDDYEQYLVEDNKITINKKFNRNRGLNPPAMNELQAVTRRYPNSMKMLLDPTLNNLESDSWIDTVGYGVHFLNLAVKSPELAFDNSDATLLSPELVFSSNLSNNYRETFAKIPNDLAQLQENFTLVHSFKPYGGDTSTLGGGYEQQQRHFSNFEGDSYQYQIMNWFHRYAHTHNRNYSEPVVTYLRMPRNGYIKKMIGKKLWEQLIANGETNYTDISEVPEELYSSMLSNLAPIVNTHPNSSNYGAWLWATQSGLNPTVMNDNELYDSQLLFSNTDEQNWNNFKYICETVGGEWQREQGNKVNYPQGLWYQFEIAEEYQGIQLRDVFSARYACASLENPSINHNFYTTADINNQNTGTYLYWNIFDIGNETDYLLDIEQFPQYSPIQRTGGGDPISGYPRAMDIEYLSLWNNIHPYSCVDSSEPRLPPNDRYYFGGLWGHQSGRVSEREISEVGIDWGISALSGWVLWIREDVSADIGTRRSPNRPNEYNLEEPANVIVHKNTLMPLQHLSKPKSDSYDYAGIKGHNFESHGSILLEDMNSLTLYSEHEDSGISTRLGCVFTFKELDISDDIKCDTFFDGKIKVRFDEETSNDENKKFVLGCGAIDMGGEEDADGNPIEFNWGTFDSAFDTDNVPLINLPLSDCLATEESMVEFNSHKHPDDMQEGHSNQFSGNLTEYIIPEFWKANNFNSLTMMYRINKEGEEASTAKLSTEIYNVSLVQYLIFGAALDSNIYANVNGRVNTLDETIDTENGTFFKYTGESVLPIDTFETQEDYENQVSPISSPFSIIYHILEKELGIEDPIETSIEETIAASDMSLSFSLNEKIKAKELINNMCTNTNIFPMFKSTSKFSFTAIKSSYNDSDINSTIIADEIVKAKFTRTPLQKVYTLVNVKYYKDYETGDYLKETGYIDGYDCYGNGDLNFRINAGYEGYSYDYIAIDRENNVFEFEADFIRNQGDAESLRNFIYMYNCNQHNMFKLTLPLKYLYLEAGDIVKFDSLIENMLAYGEDYTKPVTRNAQIIYPYFIINSINKKQKTIEVELTQLHNLEKTFTPVVGSVSRCAGIDEEIGFNDEDFNLLNNYIIGGEMYFTNEQKRVSDWNLDGYIDILDLGDISDAIKGSNVNDIIEGAMGDINADQIVNILDIIQMISLITTGESPSEDEISYGDWNNDGIINVIDIIATVNEIVGGFDE